MSDSNLHETTNGGPIVVIVSGLSGSGKTTALRAFEDRGFFAVDNMPMILIPQLVEEMSAIEGAPNRFALGVDIRERDMLRHFDEVYEKLREQVARIDIVFIEAGTEVLIRRFSETRRPHPLLNEIKDIKRALFEEKQMLNPMRELASIIIDSSALNVHQLKERVSSYIDTISEVRKLVVIVMSFGFKNGIPLEADIVHDLRFLPNPYFQDYLRDKTGLDQAVYDYVFSFKTAHTYYNKILDLTMFALPHFYAEGKTYVTIAFGCTGGHHRSVSFARRLYDELPNVCHEIPIDVIIRHREIARRKDDKY